jgi:hypothetical protein
MHANREFSIQQWSSSQQAPPHREFRALRAARMMLTATAGLDAKPLAIETAKRTPSTIAALQTYAIIVPKLGATRQLFATLGGRSTLIIAPESCTEGDKIHVKIPVTHDTTYEVVVPYTGERFQVNCGGMLGWLTVPEDFPASDPRHFGKEPPLTIIARVKGPAKVQDVLEGYDVRACELLSPAEHKRLFPTPPFISTGSHELDRLLGGGVRIGGITELIGAHGNHKTQFAISMAVRTLLPSCMGGGEGFTRYIDVDSGISPSAFRAHIDELAYHFELKKAWTRGAVTHDFNCSRACDFDVVGVTVSELSDWLKRATLDDHALESMNARHPRFILSLDNHKMTFAKLQKVCKRV